MSSASGLPVMHWHDFAPAGEQYHVARGRFKGRHACRIHRQDYIELFWIEQGQCQHKVNGRSQALKRGDVVFIRQRDRHGFAAVDDGDFVLVNVAFSVATLNAIRQRDYPDDARFFWSGNSIPYKQSVGTHELEQLGQWATYLAKAPHSVKTIDWFLLNLLHMLETESPPHDQELTDPPWLHATLQAYEQHGDFKEGVGWLARNAGRTPEHLNSVIKQKLGVTTTEAINTIRMRHAAFRLRMSSAKILEICYDCGFENLGHFYRTFKKHYRMTPRAYRLHHQATVYNL